MSFWTIFGTCENPQKSFGKMILTDFVENNFLENCRQILGECSEYFVFAINSKY